MTYKNFKKVILKQPSPQQQQQPSQKPKNKRKRPKHIVLPKNWVTLK